MTARLLGGSGARTRGLVFSQPPCFIANTDLKLEQMGPTEEGAPGMEAGAVRETGPCAS